MSQKVLGVLFLLQFGIIAAQPYGVGDTIPDFQVPLCANGEGNLSFYATYNGDVNGGNYSVIWLTFFTPW